MADDVLFLGNSILTEAFPDLQPLVVGSPFRVPCTEKRHVVALRTTARRTTLPPEAERPEGVAAKRAMRGSIFAILPATFSVARRLLSGPTPMLCGPVEAVGVSKSLA